MYLDVEMIIEKWLTPWWKHTDDVDEHMVLIVIRYLYDNSDMHRNYDIMSRYIDIFMY